jgi:hypothetical protein
LRTSSHFAAIVGTKFSPRTRQALHEAASHRIGYGGEHDWHRAALLLQRCHRHRTEGKDRVRLDGQEFTGICPIAVGIAGRPTFLDLEIGADLPPEFVEPVAKGGNPSLRFRVVRHADQHTDAPHPLALLRPRRERPREGRTAE